MRKYVLFMILFHFASSKQTLAQSFPGYNTGNYTGVNGVFFNPANIADNRYHWDINLFAIDGFVGTDQGGLKFGDFTHSFNADSLRSKLLKGHAKVNTLNAVDILGPSFMINLSPRTSIAFTTRGRVVSNAKDINGDLSNALIDAGNSGITSPINLDMGNTISRATGWMEIGASLGQVFSPNGSHHFFKGGITLKYLSGSADSYLTTNNIKGTLENIAGYAHITGQATGYISVNTTGEDFTQYAVSDFFKFSGNGFGGDIGFVYEWRPDMDYSRYTNDFFANKYKLKIGISLLDFGSIQFNKSTNEAANYNLNIPDGNSFNLRSVSGKSVQQFIHVLNTSPYFIAGTPQNSSYTVKLPATLQGNVDWLYNKNWGFNFAAQINLNSAGNFNLYNFNAYSVTPRWENQLVSVDLPLSYNELTQFNAGLAFRIGPFFIGSGSIISSIFQNSKQADIHLGLHFGLLYKKKMRLDKDKDGIYDDVDKCPDEPGVARYQGCPIPDTDSDGINDEEDSCKTVPGAERYHGCPIPDRDGDGVMDEEDSCIDVPGLLLYHGCPDSDGDGIPDPQDKCPNEKGFARYQGCPVPDTDGDGVNDEEDLCPKIPGPASNRGCPLGQAALQLTADFRNILFNYNKATIRPESAYIIARAARMINEQIPSANFYIDGYTDNVGTDAQNKGMSRARAKAVADALIKEGVKSSRLIPRGFGKENPKCDNNTESGRQCNRRVEVKIRD